MSIKRSDVRLNTDAHRPARDLFVERLRSAISREGWRAHEAIDTWLDAAFLAMRGATLLPGSLDREENELRYMRIVKRCRSPRETMDDLAVMMAACTIALEAEPIDFIGPIFEEFSASSHLGQFFTPYHLSRLMAEMIIDDPERMLRESERPFLSLSEPACGVGGMALAASAVLRERGFDLARQVHWSLVDVDYSATCAAYIQLNLCGVSADVIHGNTLSVQTWLSSRTLAAVLHPKRFPAAARPLEKPSAPAKPLQLSLFGGE